MDSIRTMLGRPVVPLLLMALAVLVAGCAQVGTATWNFWDMIWSLIALFFWVMLIWIFIAIFGDIFRRNDLSGGMKAVWIIALVFLPFLGAIIYMISRPKVTAQDVQMMTQAEAAQGPPPASRRPTRSPSSRSSRRPGPSPRRSTRPSRRRPSGSRYASARLGLAGSAAPSAS